MTKFFIGTLGAIFTVIAAAFGVLAISGGASASGSPADAAGQPAAASGPAKKAPPSELAVAIGQMQENGGELATVDLRATVRDGDASGNLRFFSADDGYYNGGVHDFSCDNNVITAHGGGGLVKPDGTRVKVSYEATFDKGSGQASIRVKGRGVDYTLTGHVEGLIWCGNPTQTPPSVTAAGVS